MAPYDIPSDRNAKSTHIVPSAKNGTKVPFMGSRYNKDNILDDDDDEFSRDVSKAEDHGFGDDDDFDGVMFDDEDLYGRKEEKINSRRNRDKMMLDELDLGIGNDD